MQIKHCLTKIKAAYGDQIGVSDQQTQLEMWNLTWNEKNQKVNQYDSWRQYDLYISTIHTLALHLHTPQSANMSAFLCFSAAIRSLVLYQYHAIYGSINNVAYVTLKYSSWWIWTALAYWVYMMILLLLMLLCKDKLKKTPNFLWNTLLF